MVSRASCDSVWESSPGLADAFLFKAPEHALACLGAFFLVSKMEVAMHQLSSPVFVLETIFSGDVFMLSSLGFVTTLVFHSPTVGYAS